MATYTRTNIELLPVGQQGWGMNVPNSSDVPPIWTVDNVISSTVLRWGNLDGTVTEIQGSGFAYPSGAGTITSVLRTSADHNTVYESVTGLNVALYPAVTGLLPYGSLKTYVMLGNDSITGNSLNETLDGGAGNDTINGGDGIDIITGGSEMVVYAGSYLPDGSVLGAGSVTYAAGNDSLLGGGGNDNINGGVGDDTLDGGAGNDALAGTNGSQADFNTLIGGAGDDTLYAQLSSDPYLLAGGVNANGGPGTDTLFANFSHISQAVNINAKNPAVLNSLPDGSTIIGIEQLAIKLGAGNDVVREGAGVDLIWTGDGNDTVYFGGSGDGHGVIDLGAGDDKLIATGALLAGFTSGGGVLDAGTGFDELVYDLSSFVVPVHMQYGVDYFGGFEKITATGGSANDTVGGGAGNDTLNGGAGSDLLVDNTGNDFLDGGAGDDTMAGGNGDDTYVVDSAGDIVSEDGTTGTDLIKTTASFTLGAGVENLTLIGAITGTGNDGANKITGDSAANTLNGGAGADSLIGGAGNDTYIVDNAGDKITETAALNGGTDLVQSSVTRTLGANQENLELTGSGAINGVGNALNNTITGNEGANQVDGKAGADVLAGGAGGDTYIVDDLGDQVSEQSGGGNDLVKSSVDFGLSANVERLTLTGSASIDGTGNELSNKLIGNSGANEFHGGKGADSLYGKDGADVLYGDQGNDRFYFDTPLGAGNVDTIADFLQGGDKIVLDSSFYAGAGTPGQMVGEAFSAHIVYNASDGSLSYDADGVGTGSAAVQFAVVGLDIHPLTLSAADFLIVA